MSQHNKKHSFIFSITLAALAMIITLAGCKDDFTYEAEEIPNAEVEVEGEVFFKPLMSTEVQTRADKNAPEGKEYNGITSLYVFFFNEDKNMVEKKKVTDFTIVPSDGSTHNHVTFKTRVQAGKYYVFAVTNIPVAQESELLEVTTIDELRKFKISWNNNIVDDLEMFGVFTQDEDKKELPKNTTSNETSEETVGEEDNEKTLNNEMFEEDILLSITPSKKKIHSWVRRAASKVTIDFNGSGLKDGVTVYIKKATLKDMADGAFLGKESAISEESGFGFWTLDTETKSGNETETKTEYAISYGKDENGLSVTNKADGKNPSPSDAWNGTNLKSFHDDAAKALPCYENMQGVHEDKSKLQDKDKDGIIDSYTKDNVPNGTYLEVEGYYKANRPEYKSEGKIIYRFMLGKNAENDFNLMRNHHYKITMNFKDYGNDIDWHIEYAERYFDVSYPTDVNYKGNFFVPSNEYTTLYNAGHDFSNNNIITVTSYKSDGSTSTWDWPTITYTDYSYNDQTGEWTVVNSDLSESSWLKFKGVTDVGDGLQQKQYSFVASKAEMTETTINKLLDAQDEVGTGTPYNLSSSDGNMTIEETANCYMVGAPGWYCFPLVYGNGITNKVANSDAYPNAHFVNHLNKPITKTTGPYIKDYVDPSNISVKLIWQDAENNMASKVILPSDISYDPTLFNNIGGIKFRINSLREGNAVIAIIDNSVNENTFAGTDKVAYNHITKDDNGVIDRGVYGQIGSTNAIWSWHIWVTRFGFDNFEKDIQVRNHNHAEDSFQVMPVNLGWCSGGKEIRYYKRRKCDIKFKVGDKVITRTVVQYPHFVVPRGDHPYYQWGRKDPFVGSNTAWGNKQRWNGEGGFYEIWSGYNPPRLFNEPGIEQEDGTFKDNYEDDRRHNTTECLFLLIQNPDKWHNSPRTPKPDNAVGFNSINVSYSDLWSNGGKKTIYDPCPPGYHVGDRNVFTGLTISGENTSTATYWYDVLEENMDVEDGYYGETLNNINSQVLEFYTDTRKIQSIAFPVTGYRDYDNKAAVTNYPTSGEEISFAWTNEPSVDEPLLKSFHLKFYRKYIGNGNDWKSRGDLSTIKDEQGKETTGYFNQGVVSPQEKFFNTNGYAVRPVRIQSAAK